MNILSEIIANAMDLASGGVLDLNLNSATLYAMNVVADMELQMSGSLRGRQTSKIVGSFTARTGTLPALPVYIRYRTNEGGRWEIIDIVGDIEDLTEAENHGRRAIIFYGSGPFNYELSFTPYAAPLIGEEEIQPVNQVELWGSAATSDLTSLAAVAPLPAAFTHLAANRTAVLLLGDLLLMPNGATLAPYVQSRTQSLMYRQRELEHRWTVYRSGADNSLSDAVTRAYDPFEPGEFGTVFEGKF